MIDLSKYAGQAVKNRIKGLGIELEGAWRNTPRGGMEITRDGSLDVWRAPQDAIAKGEIPSPVLQVGDEVSNWLKSYYPHYCDHPRCAMHVHMSVGDHFRYQQVMQPEYMLTVIHYLTEWAKKENFPPGHHIWDRLEGRVEYCKPIFDADRQVRMRTKGFDHDTPGNRYTAINYAWDRLRTFECRLLPMMPTVEQAERAVVELVDITNKFLLATARTEKKVRGEVAIDGGPEVRESITII